MFKNRCSRGDWCCVPPAEARQHDPGAAGLCSPEQVLDRDLPYLEILFCLWQFGDVGRRVAERDELSAIS
jgi:hypothetical protein